MKKSLTHLPEHKAVSFSSEFLKVFPQTTSHERRATSDEIAFKLLKKAYIDARYKASYRITKKQLEYLAERVKVLQRLTKRICTEKIKSFA